MPEGGCRFPVFTTGHFFLRSAWMEHPGQNEMKPAAVGDRRMYHPEGSVSEQESGKVSGSQFL